MNNGEECDKFTDDAEETVREEPSAVLNARVTSTTGLPAALASQSLPATNSNVAASVGRPNIAQQQLLSRPVTMITNPTTTSISSGRLASTSIASTSQAKVTEYLNSINLSPLHLTASPERLSSTLRLNQQTRQPNVNPTVARTDVTTAISTAF